MKDKSFGLSAFLAALLVVVPAMAQNGGSGSGGGHQGTGTGGGRGSGGGTGTSGGHGSGGGTGTGSGGAVHVSLPPGWGVAPASPFGNVNHPGGVTTTPMPSFIQPLPTVVQPLVSPFPANPTVFPPGRGHHRIFVDPVTGQIIRVGGLNGQGFLGGFGRVIVVPVPVAVAVPVSSDTQQPTVIIIQQTPAGPAAGETTIGTPYQPPVIYNYESAQPPSDKPSSKVLTLLVFKDHSIYAVTDYWVEGDRLHYVTSYGAHNSIALDQLDLEFSKRLNEERNIKFDLKKDS